MLDGVRNLLLLAMLSFHRTVVAVPFTLRRSWFPDGEVQAVYVSKISISEQPPHPLDQGFFVETNGIEPSTSCLQSRRSTN